MPESTTSIKMEFTTNSVRNTTISMHDDTVYYEIVTRHWEPTLTKINKIIRVNGGQDTVPVAEIYNSGYDKDLVKATERGATSAEARAEALGMKVRFMGSWMDVDDFIQYDDDVGGLFRGENGTLYLWKIHKGKLQLTKAETDRTGPPLLAKYHRHRRYFFFLRMYRHASLEITVPEVVSDGTMDRLIVSYILAERKRRDARHHRILC